jgi:hypothetical protein
VRVDTLGATVRQKLEKQSKLDTVSQMMPSPPSQAASPARQSCRCFCTAAVVVVVVGVVTMLFHGQVDYRVQSNSVQRLAM